MTSDKAVDGRPEDCGISCSPLTHKQMIRSLYLSLRISRQTLGEKGGGRYATKHNVSLTWMRTTTSICYGAPERLRRRSTSRSEERSIFSKTNRYRQRK